jgi:hypothetical protein
MHTIQSRVHIHPEQQRDKTPARVYLCPHCLGYHLTSKAEET